MTTLQKIKQSTSINDLDKEELILAAYMTGQLSVACASPEVKTYLEQGALMWERICNPDLGKRICAVISFKAAELSLEEDYGQRNFN